MRKLLLPVGVAAVAAVCLLWLYHAPDEFFVFMENAFRGDGQQASSDEDETGVGEGDHQDNRTTSVNRTGEDAQIESQLREIARQFDKAGDRSSLDLHFQRAFEIRSSLLGPEHPDMAESLDRLARVALTHGRCSEAHSLFQQSLEIRESAGEKQQLRVVQCLDNLALSSRFLKRYDQVEYFLSRALKIREAVSGIGSTDLIGNLDGLARAHMRLGRFAEARRLRERSLAIRRRVFGEASPEIVPGLASLADACSALGDHDEAAETLEEALHIVETSYGVSHLKVLFRLLDLATERRRMDDYAVAASLSERAKKILATHYAKDNPDVVKSFCTVARHVSDPRRPSPDGRLYGPRATATATRQRFHAHTQAVEISLDVYRTSFPVWPLPDFFVAEGYEGEIGSLFEWLSHLCGTTDYDFPSNTNSFNPDSSAETYRNQGRFDLALRFFEFRMAVQETAFCEENPRLLGNLEKQAMENRRRGTPAATAAECKKALPFLETIFGRESACVARCLDCMAESHLEMGQNSCAEIAFTRALAIREELGGENSLNVVPAIVNLARAFFAQGRWSKAENLYTRALAIQESASAVERPVLISLLAALADVYMNEGKFAASEATVRRALALQDTTPRKDNTAAAENLDLLADIYLRQARYDEGRAVQEHALTIRTDELGEGHSDVASNLDRLADISLQQGDFDSAEIHIARALQIQETVDRLARLGSLRLAQGRHDEALQAVAQATTMQADMYRPACLVREFGESRDDYMARVDADYDLCQRMMELATGADSTSNLSSRAELLYLYSGRPAESEAAYRRLLAVLKQESPQDSYRIAWALLSLATLVLQQDRYEDAKPLFDRATRLFEDHYRTKKASGINLAYRLENIGDAYFAAGRYDDAFPYYAHVVEIGQKRGSLDSSALHRMACIHLRNGQLHQAKRLCDIVLTVVTENRPRPQIRGKQGMSVTEEKPFCEDDSYGPFDVRHEKNVARCFDLLAAVFRDLRRDADAERLFRGAVEVQEGAAAGEDPLTAPYLLGLADLYHSQGCFVDAEPLCRRAVKLVASTANEPGLVLRSHECLAKVLWGLGQRSEAVTQLRSAMAAAEQMVRRASGIDYHRAQAYGQFAHVFERMVRWQTELGDLAETLSAMERTRARSLIDQMETNDMDLLAGIPEDQAERLRDAELRARSDMAANEEQFRMLSQREDVPESQRAALRSNFEDSLSKARESWVEARADIRNASPTYRLAIGKDRKPATLSELQAWATDRNALVLEYLLGDSGGYLLVVPPGGPARLETLAVDAGNAELLEISSGPLTADRLETALCNDKDTGLLQQLRGPAPRSQNQGRDMAARLSALWEFLLPASEREALQQGRLDSLVVVPHGLLSQLPFETLVIENAGSPRYLLDVGPPVTYAPSATVLLNLARRESAKEAITRSSVLTLGDPSYQKIEESPPRMRLAATTPGTRYRFLQGTWAPLPFSGWETDWLVDVFQKQNIAVTQLKGNDATEASVRREISGHRIVHLACHGLADDKYGNMFGALVLGPGPEASNPDDDGFLRHSDICELDLGGCELAILSACETNVGPHQHGEGVWALSRGFLVAGARRVVASNWRVDDESAANLVSYFGSVIARQQGQGESVDYAEALHKAKRWVRRHPDHAEWSSPYYWSTFVLIGPQ